MAIKSVSKSATVQYEVTKPVSKSVTVQYEVITYPQKLLDVARKLIDDGQFSIAVVVTHMACEIATERSLSKAATAKGFQSLKEAVKGKLNGYSLANKTIRKLYTKLTGDEIQKQKLFWKKFKDSAKRRNDIIHEGKIVEKEEAEESFKATTKFIAHLKK